MMIMSALLTVAMVNVSAEARVVDASNAPTIVDVNVDIRMAF